MFARQQAMTHPDKPAIIMASSGETVTFGEYEARSNRVANALLARGVGKGDRVALLLMNGVEFAAAFFAIAKIGAVIVPLNWRLVADELAFILADSGARHVRDPWRLGRTLGLLSRECQESAAKCRDENVRGRMSPAADQPAGVGSGPRGMATGRPAGAGRRTGRPRTARLPRPS